MCDRGQNGAHRYGPDFDVMGAAFDVTHAVDVHHINDAEVRFFRQHPLGDFAVDWMEQNRAFRKR